VGALDRVVGDGEHCRRYFQVQLLRDLEVDDKLEFCWQLYREIGGFVTFENLIDVRSCATEKRDTARPIGCEGTCLSPHE
jgi:hypothetical protein